MRTHHLSRWLAGGVLSLTVLAAVPAAAQSGQDHRQDQPQQGNNGDRDHRPEARATGNWHIPAYGPSRSPWTGNGRNYRRGHGRQQPMERPADRDGNRVVPHVDPSTDHWVGRDEGRYDRRFRLHRTWEHGRFPGAIGPRNVWRLEGGDRNRFIVGGRHFRMAEWDYEYASDWRWNDDPIVIYLDPDHYGWYFVYNVRLGTYVHGLYDGE